MQGIESTRVAHGPIGRIVLSLAARRIRNGAQHPDGPLAGRASRRQMCLHRGARLVFGDPAHKIGPVPNGVVLHVFANPWFSVPTDLRVPCQFKNIAGSRKFTVATHLRCQSAQKGPNNTDGYNVPVIRASPAEPPAPCSSRRAGASKIPS